MAARSIRMAEVRVASRRCIASRRSSMSCSRSPTMPPPDRVICQKPIHATVRHPDGRGGTGHPLPHPPPSRGRGILCPFPPCGGRPGWGVTPTLTLPRRGEGNSLPLPPLRGKVGGVTPSLTLPRRGGGDKQTPFPPCGGRLGWGGRGLPPSPSPVEGEGNSLPLPPLRGKVGMGGHPLPHPPPSRGRGILCPFPPCGGRLGWGCPDRLQNHLGHRIRLREDIVVPEPNKCVALPPEPNFPSEVARLLVHVMPTINLDDQAPLEAYEVDDIRANRVLAAEPHSVNLSSPQELPQPTFGIGGIGPQLPRALNRTQCTPLPNPPPQGERGLEITTSTPSRRRPTRWCSRAPRASAPSGSRRTPSSWG